MKNTIEAIDVHGHYGRSTDQTCALTNRFTSGDAREVVRRSRGVGIGLTVVSPLAGLMIRSHDEIEEANAHAARTVARWPELRQWVVLDPLNRRTFDQAARMLQSGRCVGIKAHPEQHRYAIRKHGRAIFAFAEKHAAVVASHTGQSRSMPGDFVPFANAFPGVRLILCHLGYGYDGDCTHQVRAIQKSRHGNVFTDTSSAKSLTPNLIEWAAREVGVDRVLFGSDTPLYSVAMQRARIESADLSARDKRRILRDNALKLLFPKGKQRP